MEQDQEEEEEGNDDGLRQVQVCGLTKQIMCE